ncbi:(2Fe-2S) ferredoxin domain-containing protein [Sporanaerobacter acetigenes]|uniref:Thioredoxin-like [2Fe-2S] ferredoxin n=1 Tax=Sporanaerobacter acetigenes DSM 13106 TaxID=1123281 RepID=A0A1M5Z3Z9_9FIRM|nr:(2Fe-2S) ferredoxin domain-containing protein [Sporanaerobacter acetigenes]SHI19006.1 Thioredoxin-like [2Fe-2S] ferredoxin [Sporanaerobacter acetigenes DSM 13106]
MIVLNVCIGSACHLKGSYNVINKFQDIIKDKGLEDEVVVKAAFCLGECTKAVSVKIDDEETIYSVNEKTAEEFFNRHVLGRL